MYSSSAASRSLLARLARPSHTFSRPTTSAYTRSTLPLSLARAMSSAKSQTLSEAVAEDHREMYTYYDEYTKASGNPDKQERWARQLIWEVARHAIAEELVVYPMMEEHLGEKGKQLADHDRAEHQEVKNRLYNLEDLSPGTSQHASLLKEIMDHLKPHNDSEENEDLPLLEAAIGREDSQSAAKSFERTKKFVPTRSHPSAPNKPPFETLAGLMAAPMDKLKDAFAKFPSDEEKKEAKESHN